MKHNMLKYLRETHKLALNELLLQESNQQSYKRFYAMDIYGIEMTIP